MPPPSGASPAEPIGAAGTVVVRRDGGEITRQRLGDGERFRFELAAGTYELKVSGVEGACVSQSVTVVAGDEQDVRLVCGRK
jgi:hypothetical protein